jgi:glycosyltransferase involved in cell wall biosynthesis
MPKLSICIPTFNRAYYLENCLKSLCAQDLRDVEICISDNASNDNTATVIKSYEKRLGIQHSRSPENIGMAANILKVADLARGVFVWIVGDDDFFLPGAIEKVISIIDSNHDVDYIYVNSLVIDKSKITEKFSAAVLDEKQLPLFSAFSYSGIISFNKLIDPRVSFDFLGGIFLSVVRREKWILGARKIDKKRLYDKQKFSSVDNTFPHVKIFAHSLIGATAYFYPKPLTANIFGVREWSALWPLVKSIRIVECLDLYRRNGLSFIRYFFCKNLALNTFFPDMIIIMIGGESRGRNFLNIQNTFTPLVFVGAYWSILRPFLRKGFYLRLYHFLQDRNQSL